MGMMVDVDDDDDDSKVTVMIRDWCLGPGGGYPQKNWEGVCSPLHKTLTLFMTKICNIFPIYDLTKNLIPYL